MHGHGVNLRHIGLLRSLLLKEVEAAAADAARSRSAESAADIDSYPDSLSVSEDSYDGSQHVASTDRPLDTTEGGRCAPMPSDRRDCEPSDSTHSGAPVCLTPALYALQSELFLEALCRTLKVVYLEAAPTSVVSYRRACPSCASKAE
jgi:hypothetical protein